MALVGNKVTEKDVRDFLTTQGFLGRAARFHELELVAIERPGWVQVFQFHVSARREESPVEELFGVVRDDERHRTQIAIFRTADEQQTQIDQWSDGLIQKSKPSPGRLEKLLLFLFISFLLILGIIATVHGY